MKNINDGKHKLKRAFDDLLENMLKKVDHCFHCEKQTQEEKQKFESAVLEKLPKDYQVHVCLGTESQFKLKVTTDKLSSDDLKGLLRACQISSPQQCNSQSLEQTREKRRVIRPSITIDVNMTPDTGVQVRTPRGS